MHVGGAVMRAALYTFLSFVSVWVFFFGHCVRAQKKHADGAEARCEAEAQARARAR